MNPPSRDGKRKTNLHKFMDGKSLKNWFVIDAARCRDFDKFIKVHTYTELLNTIKITMFKMSKSVRRKRPENLFNEK